MKDPKNIKITFNPEFLEALRLSLSRNDEQKQKAIQRFSEVLYTDLEFICSSYESITALIAAVNDRNLLHASHLLFGLNEKLATCFKELKAIESVLSK